MPVFLLLLGNPCSEPLGRRTSASGTKRKSVFRLASRQKSRELRTKTRMDGGRAQVNPTPKPPAAAIAMHYCGAVAEWPLVDLGRQPNRVRVSASQRSPATAIVYDAELYWRASGHQVHGRWR